MGTKTAEEVERDFYSFVKNGDLGAAIKGTVYRDEMRPANAETEDLVIKFLTGLDEQVQSGVVIFNLYVPDKLNSKDGRKVIDHSRVNELEKAIRDFVEKNENTEYWLQTDTTPTTMTNEDIGQHLIYARIKFYRLAQ